MKVPELVSKYHITLLPDGRIKAMIAKKDRNRAGAEIKEKKPEIVAYLKAKENQERLYAARRKKAEDIAFSIPGVRELECARNKMDAWRDKFNRAMDNGDSIFPARPIAKETMQELENNRDAAFVLSLYNKYLYMSNDELWSIARECFLLFADDFSVDEIRVEYKKKSQQFAREHFWD